ncbi:hypothetical protein B0J18DRAFT_206740 [Chaetomium sp. MPI-SDFR-AT-0129]|nr:hypothetical protein B0J18DRAFT_206740 [Chaetomium sp. MPI-SDFR-AT-0129]
MSRRVYFEDELEARRTRGAGGSRGRSQSVERSNTFDAATMAGRDRYTESELDQLRRENQYLRIQVRDAKDDRSYVKKLEAEREELFRENIKLRQTSDYTSDNEARKDAKLRKKNAKLEAEINTLKAQLANARDKASSSRKNYDDLLRESQRTEKDLLRRMEIMRNNNALLEREISDLTRGISAATSNTTSGLEERFYRRGY